MVRKKDLRAQRKHQKSLEYKMYIFKAAEEVIIKKGYSAMTMDDVAEEAQFSKATLYNYFKSKGELILEIVANYLEDLNQQIAKIRATNVSAKTKLKEAIYCVAKFHKEKENISQVFMMDESFMKRIRVFLLEKQKLSSDLDKEFLKMAKTGRKQIFEQVCEILAEVIESVEFNEINVPEATTFLESTIQGFCHGKFWRDNKYNLDHEADLIFSYFLHGIGKKEKHTKGDKI